MRFNWDWNEDGEILSTEVRSASDRDFRAAIFWSDGGAFVDDDGGWIIETRDTAGVTRTVYSVSDCDENSIPTTGWRDVNSHDLPEPLTVQLN